jgi:hypothetical protein
MATLLDYCRDYLVSEGLVRKPRIAGASTVYPMWLEPRDGAKAPRNPEVEASGTETNDDLVVSAFRSTGVPMERHNEFRRIEMIEFWLRGRTWPLVEDFWLRLRPRFVDKNAGETKRNWSMAGLTVLESLVYVELQRIGADEAGWTFNCEISFELFQP